MEVTVLHKGLTDDYKLINLGTSCLHLCTVNSTVECDNTEEPYLPACGTGETLREMWKSNMMMFE